MKTMGRGRIATHQDTPAPVPNPAAAYDFRHNPVIPVSNTADLQPAHPALGQAGVTHQAKQASDLDAQLLAARLEQMKARRTQELTKVVQAEINSDVQANRRFVEVKVMNDDTIQSFLLTHDKPVMVLFTLTSCVGCMEMKKTALPTIVKQWHEHIDFVEFRAEQHTRFDKEDFADIGARFPTAMLFYKGLERGTCNGTANAPYWNDEINKYAHLLNIPRKAWPAA